MFVDARLDGGALLSCGTDCANGLGTLNGALA
jgi:hypothetical protein